MCDAPASGVSNIGILADNYQMYHGNEPYENLAQAGELIKHVHLSGNARHRPPPTQENLGEDVFPYLAAIGYQGKISIEAFQGTFDASTLRASLQYLRELHNATQ